jgi:hypothetical protein
VNMDNIETVVSFLTQVIQNSPTKSMRASQLAVLMRGMHPDFVLFKHGFRSFADFVAKSAPELAVVQRSGGDLVYGIRSEWAARQSSANAAADSGPEPRVEQAPTFNVRVLRTFASPNAPYKIFGNTNSGFLLVRPTRAGPMPEPWVEVPVCTASDHVQIAKEFISNLPADSVGASNLQSALGKPRWWDSFSWVARQAGVDKEWHEFRQRRLRVKLQDALIRVHIPIAGPPPENSTADQIALPRTENRPRGALISVPSNTLLRRLAIAAIQKMTTEELRSLRLPLGYLVDELESAD